MTIDISVEQLVPIGKAYQHVPGRPHKSTVWRWVLRGVRGRRLDTVICGGRRFTSVEAIERFCQQLTDPTGPSPTESRDRAIQIASAVAALDADGIS